MITVINRKTRTDIPKFKRTWALDIFLGEIKIAEIVYIGKHYVLRAIKRSKKDDVSFLGVAGTYGDASQALSAFWALVKVGEAFRPADAGNTDEPNKEH